MAVFALFLTLSSLKYVITCVTVCILCPVPSSFLPHISDIVAVVTIVWDIFVLKLQHFILVVDQGLYAAFLV